MSTKSTVTEILQKFLNFTVCCDRVKIQQILLSDKAVTTWVHLITQTDSSYSKM